MKIGINAQLLRRRYSGMDYYISDLADNLARRHPENEYLLYINARAADLVEFPPSNLIVRKTDYPNRVRLWRILWEQLRLPTLLAKDHAEIAHFPGYIMPLATTLPSVVTIPDVIALLYPQYCKPSNRAYFKYFLRRTAQRADRIITLSQNSKRDIVNLLGVAEEKIHVTYSAVHSSFVPLRDHERLRQVRHQYHLPERFILFVGNLEPKKNIEKIIEAFSLLKKHQRIEHQLVIVGARGWFYDGIFKTVARLRIGAEVRFLDYLPRTALPAIYNLADVFVFPSLYEGFGLPPLEALACGTPVVTSNRSSLPEVVGDAAITVDPREVKEIAEGIYSIISDRRLRAGLIARGRRRSAQFSWAEVTRRTLEAYRHALSDRRAAAPARQVPKPRRAT